MNKRKFNKPGKLILHFLAMFPFSILRTFARFFAAIAWYGDTSIRKVISTNIDICYPQLLEEEKKKMAHQAVIETITTGFELPRVWIHAKHDTPALYGGFDGQELIDEALAQGKGMLLIAPHLGHWEYMLHVVAHRYPCTLLCNNADDIVDIDINETIQNGRKRTGARLVEATQGIKPLVAALRAGEIVVIAPDQIPPQGKGCIFSNFFGQKAPTMTLLPRLAKVTGTVLLSGFAERQKDGRILSIIRPVDPRLYSRDLEESVEGMNKTIENLINEAPTQYLWTYKRFRLGPEGKTKVYKNKK